MEQQRHDFPAAFGGQLGGAAMTQHHASTLVGDSSLSTKVEAPAVSRTKAKRLRAVRARHERAGQAFLLAAQWAQGFPEQHKGNQTVRTFGDMVREAMLAGHKVEDLLRVTPGQEEAEFDAQLINDAERLQQIVTALEVFEGMVRVLLALVPKMEALVGRPPVGQPASVRVAYPLHHIAAMALVDATWFSALAGRLLSKELTSPSEQTAYRMVKHRRRKREKLSTVTITVHESEIETLRALGFLVGRQKPDAHDLSAAFESFLQAGLAAAFAGMEDPPFPNLPGFYLTGWAERVAAVARVNKPN